MKNIGVIVAAGSGRRVGGDIPKQFLMLNDKELLAYSLETFSACEKIDEIVLVINVNYKENYQKIIDKYNIQKIVGLVEGGNSRQDSVQNAINFISENYDDAIVLIHDAARPYVSEEIINANIVAVQKYDCCTTAIPSQNSIYVTREGKFVDELVRDSIYIAQTPQSARLSIFKRAFENINGIYTDEAALFSRAGYVPHIVLGESKNKKITFKEDLEK